MGYRVSIKMFSVLLGWTVLMVLAATGDGNAATEALPPATGIVLNQAAMAAAKGNVEEALGLLAEFQGKQKKTSLEVAEKKGYAHYTLDVAMGNYCLMLERMEAAASHYRRALEKKKDQPDVWLNLAKCLYDLGRMKPAADAFRTAYELHDPRQAKHLYYSTACSAAAGDYQTAFSDFSRLLKAHPDQVTLEWRETLVHVLLALERPAEALPHIEVLAQDTAGEKQRQWREVLLYQYMDLKLEKKAIAYARWLTDTEPVEPRWWKARAHLLLQKEGYREGLASLLAYSFLAPLTPEEISLIADIHMALEIPDEAVKYYEMLLKKETTPETVEKLVRGYMRMYDYGSALNLLESEMKKKRRPDLLMLKGNLLYETGKFPEAASVFEQLIDIDKRNGRALLMLGYAAWNTGDTDRARSAFQRAAQYEKQKKEAQEALRSLSGS